MEAALLPEDTAFAASQVRLTFPTVAIYNDPSSGEKDTDVWAWCKSGLGPQLVEDFGPVWHTGAHILFVASTKKPPPGAWLIALLNNSDQAGALGYHDLTPDGLPLGKVFAGTDRQYGQQVSVTLDHELLEMLVDPWINLAAQADDGKFYGWEVCDAIEADALGYRKNGVALSDFVTPHWFGHGAGAVDYLNHVSAPFQLSPGGYISMFDPASGQGWTQLSAAHVGQSAGSVNADAAIVASRPKVGSRRERRMVGRANWALSTYETE